MSKGDPEVGPRMLVEGVPAAALLPGSGDTTWPEYRLSPGPPSLRSVTDVGGWMPRLLHRGP